MEGRSARVRSAARALAGYIAACMLAAALAGSARAETVTVGGAGALIGTTRLLADAYARSGSHCRVDVVRNLGSGGGIRALLAGAVDIALSSRPLNDSERAQGAVETALGHTPFVFAVAASRPPIAIGLDDVLGIFEGSRSEWPDGTPIRLALRPSDDSDNEALDRFSPRLRAARMAAHARPGMFFAASDQENADFLERVPGAFGAVALTLVLSEKRKLRVLALDGVMPTPAALASRAYAGRKPLYLVTTARTPQAARRFIAFARSPAGRKVLAHAGVVPVTP